MYHPLIHAFPIFQVPNDILAGQTVEFRGYITHTDNQLLEICVSAFIDIV